MKKKNVSQRALQQFATKIDEEFSALHAEVKVKTDTDSNRRILSECDALRLLYQHVTTHMASEARRTQGIPAQEANYDIAGLRAWKAPVRNRILQLQHQSGMPPDALISEVSIRHGHEKNSLAMLRSVSTQLDGNKFLEDTFKRNSEDISELSDNDRNRFFELQELVATKFGEHAVPLVYILFNFLQGDLVALDRFLHAPAANARLSLEEKEHIRELIQGGDAPILQSVYTESISKEREPYRLPYDILTFLGIYGDVSQELYTTTMEGRSQERSEQDREHLYAVLSHPDVLKNTKFLYDVLRKRYTHTRHKNVPWVYGDLKGTPFSSENVEHIISSEIPRDVLVRALTELNDFQSHDALRSIGSIVSDFAARTQESKDAEEIPLSPVVQQFFWNRIYNLERLPGMRGVDTRDGIASIVTNYKWSGRPGDKSSNDVPQSLDGEFDVKKEIPQEIPLNEKMETLRKLHAEMSVLMPDPRTNVQLHHGDEPLLPDDLILCLFDAKKIVEDQNARIEFERTIERIETHEHGEDKRLLARSLETILYDDDRYVDFPVPAWGNRSIRHRLTDIVTIKFTEQEQKEGVRGSRDRADISFETRPLIRLIDKEMLDPSTLKALSTNFDMAKLGIWRGWLLQTASAWLASHRTEKYKKAMSFASDAMSECMGVQNGQYQFCFYNQASEAFSEIMRQCFSDLRKGDHAIILDQEYDGFTDHFTKKRDEHGEFVKRKNKCGHVTGIERDTRGVRPVYINAYNKTSARPTTVEEMYKHIQAQIVYEDGTTGAEAVERKMRAQQSCEPIDVQKAVDHNTSFGWQSIKDTLYRRWYYVRHGHEYKSPEEIEALLVQKEQEEERKKKRQRTRMIIISAKTRFGEAPLSNNAVGQHGNVRKNTYYLGQLIKKLKEDFPDIPVIIDGCQSLGRSETDNLIELGADAYIGSGTKALGIGQIGFAAMSKEFTQKHPFSFERSTQSLERIVAMSLGMLHMREKHDFMRMDGNFGENASLPNDQKHQKRLAFLTAYIIKKAREYGEIFVDLYDIDSVQIGNLIGKTREQLLGIFGCNKCHPVHENEIDFTGISTIRLPNMKGDTLRAGLAKLQPSFQVLDCLPDQEAIRVSCSYLHETHMIDALFDAIVEVHGKDFLRQKKCITDKRENEFRHVQDIYANRRPKKEKAEAL